MRATIVMICVLTLAGASQAVPIRPSAITTSSGAPSPVLTSVVETDASVDDYGTVELHATCRSATGKPITFTEELEVWTEDSHHLKYMSDPRDGYWTACHRILLDIKGTTYIVGYEQVEGDSDGQDDDENSSYGVNIPFDFDLATQTFRIRSSEMVPLPNRFGLRVWTGVHFLVPLKLYGLSKEEVETVIRGRGGIVVGSEGPVDVVVLPDRVDFCANSEWSRNRLAEKWIRSGTKVLWERYFGRPGSPPLVGEDGDWRD